MTQCRVYARCKLAVEANDEARDRDRPKSDARENMNKDRGSSVARASRACNDSCPRHDKSTLQVGSLKVSKKQLRSSPIIMPLNRISITAREKRRSATPNLHYYVATPTLLNPVFIAREESCSAIPSLFDGDDHHESLTGGRKVDLRLNLADQRFPPKRWLFAWRHKMQRRLLP